MSDRGVFVAAFTTIVLIVAGAFALPQFFPFELLKSLIFVAIAIMVFFGENKYSYMLGILAPVAGWIFNIVLGGFFEEFAILFGSIAMKPVPPLETPLHGLAIITEAILLVLCWRAWHKEVPEPFFGKVFGTSLAIAVGYVVILAAYFVFGIPEGAGMP
jgi:hypothetical protein